MRMLIASTTGVEVGGAVVDEEVGVLARSPWSLVLACAISL